MSDRQMRDGLSRERRDLGEGLLLRQAERNDTGTVARFNARIHYSSGGPFEQREPNRGIEVVTRDLMSGVHPTCDATDFTVVEDTHTGAIVSSMCLIPQKFSYEGMEFHAGLPELVGTHPDYRGRGLVREQFEVIHRWSAERGHLMQAIGGIPYYYRRFGYEMAVGMDAGRRMYAQDVPQNPASGEKDDEQAGPYRLRLAEASDAAFLSHLNRQAGERYLLTCVRDERLWRYEVAGRDPDSDSSFEFIIVEDAKREPVGYLCHARDLRESSLRVYGYELTRGISWLEVTPAVLAGLKDIGQEYDAGRPLASLTFMLGERHLLYEALPEPLLHRLDRHGHYSFYVRVPDLPVFLKNITPVLERRLAGSVAAGHTGELKISFYGDGLYLKLERGRLSAVECWEPMDEEPSDAAFPDITFLQLLFGHRSLDELDYAFADCSPGNGEVRVLLETLFPRRPSNLFPVY